MEALTKAEELNGDSAILLDSLSVIKSLQYVYVENTLLQKMIKTKLQNFQLQKNQVIIISVPSHCGIAKNIKNNQESAITTNVTVDDLHSHIQEKIMKKWM